MKMGQAGSLRGGWPIANRPQLMKLPLKLPHNPRRVGNAGQSAE